MPKPDRSAHLVGSGADPSLSGNRAIGEFGKLGIFGKLGCSEIRGFSENWGVWEIGVGLGFGWRSHKIFCSDWGLVGKTNKFYPKSPPCRESGFQPALNLYSLLCKYSEFKKDLYRPF